MDIERKNINQEIKAKEAQMTSTEHTKNKMNSNT